MDQAPEAAAAITSCTCTAATPPARMASTVSGAPVPGLRPSGNTRSTCSVQGPSTSSSTADSRQPTAPSGSPWKVKLTEAE